MIEIGLIGKKIGMNAKRFSPYGLSVHAFRFYYRMWRFICCAGFYPW